MLNRLNWLTAAVSNNIVIGAYKNTIELLNEFYFVIQLKLY